MPNPQILSIAIIGRHGQPLYMRNFTPQTGGEADLKWYYAAHTSLDVFEERDALPTKVVDAYFGLLYTMEEYACYGYQTNTRTRFVVCLSMKEVLMKETEVKAIFRSLHSAYIHYLSNPFTQSPPENLTALAPPIKSKKFDCLIDAIAGV